MIDVYINSCARPDVLEQSLESFKSNVRTSHELRYVILEDMVIDSKRQEAGKKWIIDNEKMFNVTHFAGCMFTYVRAFGFGLKLINSDYFIHLEDDMAFQHPVDIDHYIEIMKEDSRLSSVCFKKDKHRFLNPHAGVGVIYNDFFSIGTGVFNTRRTKKIVNFSGTGECHEMSVLTPAMRRMGFMAAVSSSPEHEYDILDIGTPKGYIKGKWK